MRILKGLSIVGVVYATFDNSTLVMLCASLENDREREQWFCWGKIWLGKGDHRKN